MRTVKRPSNADAYKGPYYVVTTEGSFLSRHETKEDVEAAASHANAKAEALGIEARYEPAKVEE